MGEVTRSADGKWLPGQSGNPAGRPPSRSNKITRLKQDLEIAIREGVKAKDIKDIVTAMIDEAKNGGVQAAKLILDKTISNVRPEEDEQQTSGGIRVVIENVTVGRKTETIEDADYMEITEDGDRKEVESGENGSERGSADGGRNEAR